MDTQMRKLLMLYKCFKVEQFRARKKTEFETIIMGTNFQIIINPININLPKVTKDVDDLKPREEKSSLTKCKRNNSLTTIRIKLDKSNNKNNKLQNKNEDNFAEKFIAK